METINYAIIGCGGRIRGLVEHLRDKKNVKLLGGWDPSEANVKQLLDMKNGGKGKVYSSYEDIVNDTDVDWVLVGSPNVFHREHILAAFAKGKHVFSEKPLATTIDDCLEINKGHKKSGKLFATGFTLRYASIYRKTREILSSGMLGKIVSINACENILPDHGSYIMKNWRRKKELAGPHILEKCVHDLDLLNWFTDSVPLKIAAFGGNNMFIPENQSLYELDKDSFDAVRWKSVAEKFEEDDSTPFLSEKSIEDNVVSILEYANGIRVQFQATMCNTIPERRMYFHCTKGTLIVELYTGSLRYKVLGEEAEQHLSMVGGGHGDGDKQIMKELYDSMVKGTEPVCGGEEGLLSAVVGISIDRAREEGNILNLQNIWKSLGVKL
jgi:predicted dehydrogenase